MGSALGCTIPGTKELKCCYIPNLSNKGQTGTRCDCRGGPSEIFSPSDISDFGLVFLLFFLNSFCSCSVFTDSNNSALFLPLISPLGSYLSLPHFFLPKFSNNSLSLHSAKASKSPRLVIFQAQVYHFGFCRRPGDKGLCLSCGASQGLLCETLNGEGQDVAGKGGHTELGQLFFGTNTLILAPGDKHSMHSTGQGVSNKG